MSFKPEVFVEGKWSSNALVFATKEEATLYAGDLMWRWTLVQDSRATEVDAPATHAYRNGVLERLEEVQ